MPIERRRYVGPYGHKHRTAHVPGVGNLYLNELVDVDREANEVRHVFTGTKLNDLTHEALATLYGPEFVSADTDCTYKLASGAICEKPRVEGTVYCALHGMLADVKVEAAGEGWHKDVPSFSDSLQAPDLTVRHICRFCHNDFESNSETDDVCPKCLDLTAPSQSDSPQPSPDGSSDTPMDGEPQSIRRGTRRITLRKKPPDATIVGE